MVIIKYLDHSQIKQNTETLPTEHRFIYPWLLLSEEIKILGSISKHVLCHTEKFTMRKNILLEIMQCTYKCSSSQNATVTDSPKLLTSSFSQGIKDSKG